MSKKKTAKIISIILVFVILAVSAYFYTRPSSWIDNPDKEISSVTLKEFTEYKEATITDPEKISELITEIESTKTKRRMFINVHERADTSDSGFSITINYKDGTSEKLSYSFMYNGLIATSEDKYYNVSFHNKELCNVILKDLNMNYDINELYDYFEEKYGEI